MWHPSSTVPGVCRLCPSFATMGRGIQDLSNDLLRDILDQIESNPELTISVDRRAYLSVESFRPPSPPPPPRAQDIGNFRLTCRRFAEAGIPYQFTRIATRFSPAGFERLENICNCPHLARHTRKFSYLIPDFYLKGQEPRPESRYRPIFPTVLAIYVVRALTFSYCRSRAGRRIFKTCQWRAPLPRCSLL